MEAMVKLVVSLSRGLDTIDKATLRASCDGAGVPIQFIMDAFTYVTHSKPCCAMFYWQGSCARPGWGGTHATRTA